MIFHISIQSVKLLGHLYFVARKRPRVDSDQNAVSLKSGVDVEVGGVYYHPRTKETKESYKLLLSFIQQCIGDQVKGENIHLNCPLLAGALCYCFPLF